MPEFHPGETLDRTDLALYLVDSDEQPTNAYEISYAIYYVDPVPVETEVLIGSATRTPVNPTVGEYWAALMIPPSAEAGTYRIRWTFKQYAGNAASTVTQEFTVAATEDLTVTTYNAGETAMIRSLRMQIRDNNPDRFYHFRPPEQEGRIGRYDKVFGQIWEDEELYEYLLRALDWYNSAPPATGIPSLARLVTDKPEWREAVIWNAVAKACFAVGLNWVTDQFSLAPDTMVRVRVHGVEQDITLEDLYAQGANPEGVEVRSVCPNTGVMRWSAVSAVLRHATGHKRAYRVTLLGWASVVATEDHSLFRYGSGGLPVPVCTGDLTEGQALFCVGVDDQPTGFVIDTVREVDPLEVSYDLSVPGDENFVLSNGILAHNSYSIGGVSLDINKASEYQNMASYATEQSDKAREIKQMTVKYMRGLQQPRFGRGLSALGPNLGRGQVSPKNFAV